MAEYDFRTLSPTDFEHLSRDVLNAALGLRLRSYPEGRDQGIDLREVTPDGHTTIVQCKHYARTATAGFMKAVKGEVAKPARRMADRYIFVTSHALTAARETEVARILGVPVADVWGPDALNAALAAHPDIERRHFKLWLSSVTALIAILRAGLWQRSDALLMEVAESAKYWVETSALSGLAELLEREGVCVVTGMPGIGKTMLADMTALTAARAGWQVVQPVGGTTDAWATWRPETRQLFYLDDFIGEAELAPAAADQASDWLRFISHVRRNRGTTRLLLTSGEYVLRQAAEAGSERLHRLAAEVPRYRLTPDTYHLTTRREILAGHLFFAGLPDAEPGVLGVDTRVNSIVEHPAFSPRIIEAVTRCNPPPRSMEAALDGVLQALDDPKAVWDAAFAALPVPAREIVLTLATFGDRPVRHVELRDLAAPAGGRSVLEWRAALRNLEPLWIRVSGVGADRSISFAQAGCRAYALGLLNDPDIAEDHIQRLRYLSQLTALSRAAGLLPPVGPPRNHLAQALLTARDELALFVAHRVEEAVRSPARARLVTVLCDAAELLARFGDPATCDRFLVLVAELRMEGHLIQARPADLLALADRLGRMPVRAFAAREHLPYTLIISALESAETIHDLDAYEALPAALRTSFVHATACRRAARILRAELALLAQAPVVHRELVDELDDRARWYGLSLPTTPLHARAA